MRLVPAKNQIKNNFIMGKVNAIVMQINAIAILRKVV